MINDPSSSDMVLVLWTAAVAVALLVVGWVAYRTGVADGHDIGYVDGATDEAARHAHVARHPACADEIHHLFDVDAPDATVYEFPGAGR